MESVLATLWSLVILFSGYNAVDLVSPQVKLFTDVKEFKSEFCQVIDKPVNCAENYSFSGFYVPVAEQNRTDTIYVLIEDKLDDDEYDTIAHEMTHYLQYHNKAYDNFAIMQCEQKQALEIQAVNTAHKVMERLGMSTASYRGQLMNYLMMCSLR